MSLVGLVDDIWPEVALSGEENTLQNGGDAGNVFKFWWSNYAKCFDISG